MYRMKHQIEIDAPVHVVFDLIRYVECWPAIFPPCKAARIVAEEGARQVIEISALANGQPMSWRSEREVHPDVRHISFRQVRPSPLLERMEGDWHFHALRSGTLAVLEHRFAVKAQPHGLVAGVTTQQEALDFMVRSTDENSQKELQALKQFLESKERAGHKQEAPPRAEFEESLTISAPPERVYALLQQATGWPELLPHCRAVDMRYDDGRNQEFVMTVEVRGSEERIRTIRRCNTHGRNITYFQPEPPPVLREHTGEWRVEPVPGGVRVVSWHAVELAPEKAREMWGDIGTDEALRRVANAINANSLGTMKAIKARVEA
uniref:First ring cyclase/aromatase n=1 Tax=Pyxidicoccus fallax TaxID=394095 RepID=A0A346D7B0_9BACT|nr:first ring cyclase/aromatase [Pyxidicoccus fallax]